jgi:protein-L-isoaspartate(D-aspartate) O-methyltransferase
MTWQQQARQLAADLAEQGVLDPGWRPAFENVPRHLFVPTAFAPDGSPRPDLAEAVYRDESLTTQVAHVPDTEQIVPTSSSTRPSLMARMLGMLDAAPGQTVLEIGTGTGYNAALLCHRLGSDAVTSIDIDPDLVDAARDTLKTLGFTPTLVAGDGAAGVPERAPFDRILATCAVPAVPGAWVCQLAVDGRLVADLRAATSSTLIAAHRDETGNLVGRFHPIPGHFMWLRPNVTDPFRTPGEGTASFDRTAMRRADADPDPQLLDDLDDPDFGFQLALRVPGIVQSLRLPDRGTRILRADDDSWVEIDSHTTALQSGPRSIGDEILAAHRAWAAYGRPHRSRYGLTVTPTGTSTVWLDSVEEPTERIATSGS